MGVACMTSSALITGGTTATGGVTLSSTVFRPKQGRAERLDAETVELPRATAGRRTPVCSPKRRAALGSGLCRTPEKQPSLGLRLFAGALVLLMGFGAVLLA